jgi:hypothetical protein
MSNSGAKRLNNTRNFLTFMWPCIVNVFFFSKTNKMQRYTIFFITVNALHVSGGFSAHHQELKTVHTASGICQACLLLPLAVAASKLDSYFISKRSLKIPTSIIKSYLLSNGCTIKYSKKNVEICIKSAPTCFGLKHPSSGSVTFVLR